MSIDLFFVKVVVQWNNYDFVIAFTIVTAAFPALSGPGFAKEKMVLVKSPS